MFASALPTELVHRILEEAFVTSDEWEPSKALLAWASVSRQFAVVSRDIWLSHTDIKIDCAAESQPIFDLLESPHHTFLRPLRISLSTGSYYDEPIVKMRKGKRQTKVQKEAAQKKRDDHRKKREARVASFVKAFTEVRPKVVSMGFNYFDCLPAETAVRFMRTLVELVSPDLRSLALIGNEKANADFILQHAEVLALCPHLKELEVDYTGHDDPVAQALALPGNGPSTLRKLDLLGRNPDYFSLPDWLERGGANLSTLGMAVAGSDVSQLLERPLCRHLTSLHIGSCAEILDLAKPQWTSLREVHLGINFNPNPGEGYGLTPPGIPTLASLVHRRRNLDQLEMHLNVYGGDSIAFIPAAYVDAFDAFNQALVDLVSCDPPVRTFHFTVGISESATYGEAEEDEVEERKETVWRFDKNGKLIYDGDDEEEEPPASPTRFLNKWFAGFAKLTLVTVTPESIDQEMRWTMTKLAGSTG